MINKCFIQSHEKQMNSYFSQSNFCLLFVATIEHEKSILGGKKTRVTSFIRKLLNFFNLMNFNTQNA